MMMRKWAHTRLREGRGLTGSERARREREREESASARASKSLGLYGASALGREDVGGRRGEAEGGRVCEISEG
eukprot:6182409-Pleurochrysis_carterae.AAC.4